MPKSGQVKSNWQTKVVSYLRGRYQRNASIEFHVMDLGDPLVHMIIFCVSLLRFLALCAVFIEKFTFRLHPPNATKLLNELAFIKVRLIAHATAAVGK